MGGRRSCISEVRSETGIQLVKEFMIYSMESQLARSDFLKEILKTSEIIYIVDESQN